MGVLKTFDGCPGDIYPVSWTYLIMVLKNLTVSCRYFLLGVPVIFDGCPGDL